MSDTYHGTVLDHGHDFAVIDTEGPLVILRLTLDGNVSSAAIDLGMDHTQAREIARHLSAAAETAKAVT